MVKVNFLKMKYVLLTIFMALAAIDLASGVSIEKDLSLTLSEKNTLDKFRERVKPLLKYPYMKNDIYLIRWLRARNFNLDAAETMLKENLKWRRENNMDNILNEDMRAIARDFHATIDTYDKTGRPIGVIDIFSWDIRNSVVTGRGQELLRYMDYLMENITMQVFERQAKGMNVSQWVVLANADGFNLINHGCPLCIPLWVQFINSLENHYPGWIDEFIAVDAPSTVNVIIDILRPLLSQNTRQALKIFSANRAKWMPYLDERIERSERRPQYGGTKPPAEYL